MTWLGRVRRAVLATGLLSATVLPAAAGSAGAADPATGPPGPMVVAALHTVAPSALTSTDETLVLSGTVQNAGDEAIQNAQVLPRFSRVPVQARADISRVGTDDTLNWGARYSDVYDPIDDTLEPGESQPFSLTIPTELLDFGDTGVYVVGVDVMGSPQDSEDRLRLDTARTVVPWLPDDDTLPRVPVSMLWPLAARPAMLPDATLLDNSLAAQIGAGEPLTELVTAAADAPVTWAIDPDLLDTAEVMAQGYQVMSASGPIEGSQADSDTARDWLSALRQAASGHQVVNLPYAVPDIEALAATNADLAGTVMRRSIAVSTAQGLRPGSLATTKAPVGWLDRSSVTGRALGALAVAGVNTVIVPGDAVSPRPGPTAATFSLGEAALDAVVTDVGLDDAISDAVAATDTQAGALDVRQRWFAETAFIAMSTDDDASPAPVVAAPPLRWRPEATTARAVVRAWTSIPWVEPMSLDDAVAGANAREPQPVEPQPDDSANLLPATNVDAAADVHERAGQYASLLADPDDAPDGLPLAPVRATSSGWRDDPAAGEAYAQTIDDDLSRHLDDVSVTVPESVTLSSRNGTFPLTVTNDLPQAISVGLDIDSANVDRLQIDDVEVQQIEPGARELVQVTAQAAANGKVPINVQLTTSDGVAIGPMRPTVVNATDYGTIGWVIVAGAGALFAVTLVRRAVRSRRTPDEPDAEHDADTPAADPVQEASR